MSKKIKRMDPNRFTIGERVRYVNHVMGYEIGMLEVISIDDDFVTTSRFFSKKTTFRFNHDGIAVWSPNLSIQHDHE